MESVLRVKKGCVTRSRRLEYLIDGGTEEESMVSWIRKQTGWMIVAVALASVAPLMAQTGGVTGTAKGTDGKKLAGYPIIIQ
jgi:hypothetical protein